jgi:hypothetical protein
VSEHIQTLSFLKQYGITMYTASYCIRHKPLRHDLKYMRRCVQVTYEYYTILRKKLDTSGFWYLTGHWNQNTIISPLYNRFWFLVKLAL